MPLTAFTNVFAGNPLDRASERRRDADWLAAQLNDPQSLAIALWNGAPMVESGKDGGVQLAYFGAPLAREIAGRRREAAVPRPLERNRRVRGGFRRPRRSLGAAAGLIANNEGRLGKTLRRGANDAEGEPVSSSACGTATRRRAWSATAPRRCGATGIRWRRWRS